MQVQTWQALAVPADQMRICRPSHLPASTKELVLDTMHQFFASSLQQSLVQAKTQSHSLPDLCFSYIEAIRKVKHGVAAAANIQNQATCKVTTLLPTAIFEQGYDSVTCDAALLADRVHLLMRLCLDVHATWMRLDKVA